MTLEDVMVLAIELVKTLLLVNTTVVWEDWLLTNDLGVEETDTCADFDWLVGVPLFDVMMSSILVKWLAELVSVFLGLETIVVLDVIEVETDCFLIEVRMFVEAVFLVISELSAGPSVVLSGLATPVM